MALVPPIKTSLVVVYVLMLLYLAALLALHVSGHHKLLSFKVGFLILCVVWTGSRAVWWVQCTINTVDLTNMELLTFWASPVIKFAAARCGGS